MVTDLFEKSVGWDHKDKQKEKESKTMIEVNKVYINPHPNQSLFMEEFLVKRLAALWLTNSGGVPVAHRTGSFLRTDPPGVERHGKTWQRLAWSFIVDSR